MCTHRSQLLPIASKLYLQLICYLYGRFYLIFHVSMKQFEATEQMFIVGCIGALGEETVQL